MATTTAAAHPTVKITTFKNIILIKKRDSTLINSKMIRNYPTYHISILRYPSISKKLCVLYMLNPCYRLHFYFIQAPAFQNFILISLPAYTPNTFRNFKFYYPMFTCLYFTHLLPPSHNPLSYLPTVPIPKCTLPRH